MEFLLFLFSDKKLAALLAAYIVSVISKSGLFYLYFYATLASMHIDISVIII